MNEQSRLILISYAITNNGDWNGIYQSILNKTQPSDEELAKAEQLKGSCVTMLDNEYPEVLKQSFKPPFVLFYIGNKDLLKKDNIVAVVGSRNPKQATLRFTEKFVAKRSETIITTLSQGVNTKVLETALKNGNNTIVVMANGLDYCYPKENEDLYNEVAKTGLIISEYPFGVMPDAQNFPFRTRIVSGLCKVVCVMDLVKHSGTLMLINNALQGGKDIYITPDIEEEESEANNLINQGANCLTLSTEIF